MKTESRPEMEARIREQERQLFHANNQKLWDYCAENHSLHLLESEVWDLWWAATATCRKRIAELERKDWVSPLQFRKNTKGFIHAIFGKPRKQRLKNLIRERLAEREDRFKNFWPKP